MIEHFTPAVVRALELARRVAAALEATEVAPLHVLRALLQEEEGRPFLMLRDVGGFPAAGVVVEAFGRS